MRIVMPLFNFINSSRQEFVFGNGTYSLRRFYPDSDVPKDDAFVRGLSVKEMQWIKREPWWALVAKGPDLTTYQEDINRLLLSFKIHTLGRLFIKYRLCAANVSLCSVISETMTYVLPQKSPLAISADQLHQVNLGFERLQEMDAIDSVSNRTHNAIYFMYGAYFNARHAVYLFVLLFTVLEALFSKEQGGGATKTICKRASCFLGSKPRCTYADIERLYNIRSELLHGRRKVEPNGTLADAHELEFVVTECMKKVLSDRTYLKYNNLSEKESFFDWLTSGN